MKRYRLSTRASFYLDHYMLLVSRVKEAPVRVTDLETEEDWRQALKQGRLKVVGTFAAEVAPGHRVVDGEHVRVCVDEHGWFILPVRGKTGAG